jgi:hypothetical protein
MRESLKNIDKDDIAGAILVSATGFIIYYIIYFIQNI